jgi:hypothetical protein
MFLPESERPRFALIWNNWQNYSFVYLNKHDKVGEKFVWRETSPEFSCKSLPDLNMELEEQIKIITGNQITRVGDSNRRRKRKRK